MASDFLKKMAEQQAAKIDAEYGPDAYGGSNWRAERVSASASAPVVQETAPAAPVSPAGNTGKKSSAFLQSQAQAARERIDAEYGADAYGGSNYRFNTTPAAPAISWPSVEKAQTDLQSWSTELDEMYGQLETIRADAETKAAELEGIYGQLQIYQADSRFGSDPLISSAYDNLVSRYNAMLPSYLEAASAHDTLAGEYNTLLEKYQSGYTAYTTLLSGQKDRAAEYRAQADELEEENRELSRLIQAQTVGLSRAEPYGVSQSMRDKLAADRATYAANEEQIAQLRAQAEQADAYYYASIPLMDDYAQYSAAGESKRGSMWGTKKMQGDHLYDFINNLPIEGADGYGYRDSVRIMSAGTGQQDEYGGYTAYSYMTEDEIGVYNYLYATQGREAAEAFLAELMNSLNYRMGSEEYENLTGVGKALYWIPAGVDRFASGIGQLFSEEALPTSPIQYTSSMVSQEANEISPVLGTAYELGTTVSNMAPSILLGYLSAGALGTAGLAAGTAGKIGGAIGSAGMGLSAGGNAYTQKVNEGYTPEQARSYATLVGASEAALQYLLGGLAGAGGLGAEQVLTKLAPKIAAIDNALLRAVVNGGVRLTVRGTAEGIEEGLQAFLEPAYATLIMGEEYDWGENFENAAYSFLLGFLASGVFEGVSLAGGTSYSKAAGFDTNMDGYMGDAGTDYFAGCNTAEEVETRYRELARQHHPDLGGDTATMATINRQHDMRKAWHMGQQQAQTQESTVEPLSLPSLVEPETDTAPTAPAGAAEDVTSAFSENMHVKQEAAQATKAATETAQEGGLTLPSLEPAQNLNTAQRAQQAPIGAETAAPAAETMNGGMEHAGQQQNRGADQTDAAGVGTFFDERNGLSDGGQGRLSGPSAGEQAGGLGAGAARAVAPAEQGRAAISRQSSAKRLRAQKVSSIDLGLANGTETPSVSVVAEESWDEGLRATAERVYQETGLPVTFVLGSIPVKTASGGVRNVRGVYGADRIILQADNLRVTTDQIADHEIYHDKAFQTPGLNRDIEEQIMAQYSAEEFADVVRTYVEKLRGVVDLPANASAAEIDEAVLAIKEEIFADAYAGINSFGAHAERYQGAVEQVMEKRGAGRQYAAATERTTGPPSERYSYGGRNANRADSDALAQAERLEMQGVDEETIRQQTGWHRGADGLWRFEIDDSGMEYRRTGDASRMSDPEYREYLELWDKGVARAEATEEELERLRELDARYGRVGMLSSINISNGNATLGDILVHDELFRNYPQLRRTGIRFADLEPGVRGEYRPGRNEITLDNSLRGAPEDTLIHEIQHAIQRAEGFATGSSTEYWRERLESGFDNRTHAELAHAESLQRQYDVMEAQDPEFMREAEALYATVPDMPRGQVNWDTMEQIEEDPIEWQEFDARRDALEEKYGEKIYDFFMLKDDLNRARIGKREATDLYYNTAGEIEARDAAKRRTMTAEQRRAAAPDIGDEDVVFAGDGYVASTDEGSSIREQLRAHQNELNAMEPVATVTGKSAKGTAPGALRKEIIEKLRPTGFKVERIEFGEIIFDEKRLNTSLNYLDNDADAIAYQAIPQVLKRGKDFGGHDNHKDRNYSTVTIAAPVVINGKRGNMAVVVKKTGKNYYKMHRVLTPDGKVLDISEKEMQSLHPAEGVTVSGSLATPISSASGDIISQNTAERNSDFSRVPIEERISGDTLLDAQDLIETVQAVGAEVDAYGNITVYHRTSPAVAEKIRSSGRMTAKEDGLFFSTVERGQNEGYGEAVLRLRIPAEQLVLDDIFDAEAHLRLPLEGARRSADVSGYLEKKPERYSVDEEPEAIDYNRTAILEQGTIDKYLQDYASKSSPNYAQAYIAYMDPEEFLQLTTSTAGRDVIEQQSRPLDLEEFRSSTKYQPLQLHIDHRTGEVNGHEGRHRAAALNNAGVRRAPVLLFDGSNKTDKESIGILTLTGQDFGASRSTAQVDVTDLLPFSYANRDKIISRYATQPAAERIAESYGRPTVRYSVDEDQTAEQEPKRKKREPVAESLPIIAKRDLRQNLLGLFSIPEGMKAELGTIIDQYADRLLKNGSLSQADMDAFFDRMYAEGVMTMPADEYYATGRQAVKGGRVYVSERDQHEFGDDWNYFRKRAFANGIYLTNNRSDMGIDSWNMELAEMLPGLFDAEELDNRAILERIVQVAEEGKDQKMSLAEYTQELAGQEYVSEDEILDNMERQMDWALRTFAEKAKLEVHLRDRTGVKIAQEREKFSQSAQRREAKEAARRAKERDDRKAMQQRQRDNRELRELQQKTLKQLQWLSKNRYRAPEELQSTWDEVLGDIDIYAVGAANEMNWSNKYGATWKDLAQLYKTAKETDPNFLPSKELEKIVARLDGDKIADLDVDALQDLYRAAVGIRTEFYNRNNVINDEMNRLFAEVYTDAKREIESAPGGYKGKGMDKFLNLEQLTPMNVLQRMGGWDPDGAFFSMARQLEQGERDIRAYTVRANRQLEEFLTEHEDWVKKADGQGKDGIWYEIEVPELLELGMGDKPIFGDTIKVYMTPAQKVHLYLESKNTDNLRHMTGGRTFADRELYSKGKRTEALAQGKTIRLAPETVKGLVKDLTEEEMELARLLENYYNGMAKQEINRVANILYGYDKAQSRNYAPIYTNRNYTKSEIGIYDTTAEGVGNLKSRQYAKNPSYNISAFDAFERHVEQTARFVGMAIPARNWTTLLNWREKNNSMDDVITHKWGDETKQYIEDLLNRLQGGTAVDSDSVGKLADKVLSNYISAIFGANPSIVLKQLGSIPLASVYLGPRNFPSPAQVARIDRDLIGRYTSDLAWRTMGYTTPETKQLKENPNWTETNKFTRFTFGGGAITAMDGWAASTLWPWAENKVRREHPELEVGTQEQIDAGQSPFYKKVAEEFNNAVSRSQSVSDETHQSKMRKSKNPITRAFTMFKSDAAQGYNALRQKIGEARHYERSGDKDAARRAKRAVGGTFVSLIGGYLWASAISFLIALWKNKGKYYRDDDGQLTFESVAKEMGMDLVGSLAGIVAGGEELVDIIGNVLTGDRWWGIDTPGMEQLTDIIELLQEKAGEGLEILEDAVDIVNNGGDLGEYLRRHGNDILGSIKELAVAAATYIPGIPVSNLEAYILGSVKWISPELGAAYEDLMQTAEKSDLTGLEGDALENRVDTILDLRVGDTEDATAAELAGLYEAGHKSAVPTDTPTQATVNGETRELTAYQQQTYDRVWRECITGTLDDLASQEWYAAMDPERRAKTVAKLYDYAAQSAKATLFDDFEPDSFVEKINAFQAAGMSATDYLQAWNRYNEIDESGANASERATEFAYWADSQGYTTDQAQLVKDSFKTYSHIPVEAQRYADFQAAGLNDADARKLTAALSALEPLEGAASVSDMQRLRTIAAAGLPQEDMVAAMGIIMGTELETESGGRSQYGLMLDTFDAGYTVDEWLDLKDAGYMTESTFAKVQISGRYDISPAQYIRYRELLVTADALNEDPAKRNESIDQSETAAAINGMLGLTNEQKAVLWQLQNKSWKPNKNPFSTAVGQTVYDYLHDEGGLPSLTGEDDDPPGLSLPSLNG